MPQADAPLRIAVAGGSIGGLCAGLALHGSGFDVQVYERHPGPMETRGAGIVVQGELLQLLRNNGAPAPPTTSCRMRRYLDPDGGDGQTQPMPQDFTSWEAIYRTLRAAFPNDRYYMGADITGVEESENAYVTANVAGHGQIEADIFVSADGAQSPTRRRLLPEVTSRYAGYVAWRGTLDEADAPPELVRTFDNAFTFSESRAGGHILVYFIPGDNAETAPGKRRLNWVWYVRIDEADLAATLIDRNGVQHHASLPIRCASDTVIRDLIDLARREVHPKLAALVSATPNPFLQTIIDVVVPRTVFGRLCLLGDAAFVVRPHTAGATAKAARDATVLASALKRARQNVDAGLASFQDMQLEYGQAMTQHGIALGDRWAKAR
jgi:2-polyprenyl-6-methoxyphenol hydroxylase-like FAD-dependent oxidoreductase